MSTISFLHTTPHTPHHTMVLIKKKYNKIWYTISFQFESNLFCTVIEYKNTKINSNFQIYTLMILNQFLKIIYINKIINFVSSNCLERQLLLHFRKLYYTPTSKPFSFSKRCLNYFKVFLFVLIFYFLLIIKKQTSYNTERLIKADKKIKILCLFIRHCLIIDI